MTKQISLRLAVYYPVYDEKPGFPCEMVALPIPGIGVSATVDVPHPCLVKVAADERATHLPAEEATRQ